MIKNVFYPQMEAVKEIKKIFSTGFPTSSSSDEL